MPALSGVTVVVTRPEHQADNLCQLIESAGGEVLRFPVIEIRPPKDPNHCRAQLAQLAEYDLAIFVSANAVNSAMAILDSQQAYTSPPWPTTLPIATVGKATAQAIEANGLHVTHIAPKPFNSEALLSVSALQKVDGKRILIFRGEGGREILRESLLERGAKVDYVECYQRAVPQTDTTALYAGWANSRLMPIVVTSNEGLQNLLSMVGKKFQPTLLAAPLIVISERTASLSAELGFTHSPVIATAANDDAILAAVKTWAGS